MSSDAMQLWLNNAARQPLLTKEEVLIHARTVQSWQNGDIPERVGKRSLTRMVTGNLRLCVNAWRSQFSYVNANDPRALDLLQEGVFGLQKAAMKFDPSSGYQFSTYATHWVRRYMQLFLRDCSDSIRVSPDCHGTYISARKHIQKVYAESGRIPTTLEIAEAINKKPERVRAYLRDWQATRCGSLNFKQQSGDGKAMQLLDIVPSNPAYDLENDARAESLNQVLQVIMSGAKLKGAEKEMVIQRMLNSSQPMTFKELAEELDYGRARRGPQILKRSLLKCERYVASKGLKLDQFLTA